MNRLYKVIALSVTCGMLAGCGGGSGPVQPDPIIPQYYTLGMLDNGSLPYMLHQDAFGGKIYMVSARLIPYAVGRTIDKRLMNDRTGGGASGGNTRDTTVARGQFMDIRNLNLVAPDGGITPRRDSTLVDVMVRDTMFVISRPHPDPGRVRVDTGYFVGVKLIVPTVIDYRNALGMPLHPALLNYQITN